MTGPLATASRRALLRPVLFGAVATVLVLGVAQTSAFRGFEVGAQALVLRQRGPLPWNPRVFVADLDEESYATLGRPVPRLLTARLLNAMTAAGVRAVAFDIIYDNAASDGLEADAAFAQAIAANGHVVLPVSCYQESRPARGHVRAATLPAGPTPSRTCPGVSLPLQAFCEGAELAHVGAGTSDFGYLRSITGVVELGGLRLPALGLLAWLRGQGKGLESIEQRPDALVVAGLRLPVDADGDIAVSFRGYHQSPQVLSYAALVGALLPGRDVFRPDVAGLLKDSYVLVGTSVDATGDVGVVASGERQPLVSLHAALLSDLLDGELTRDVPPLPAGLLTLLAGALLAAAALWLATWRGALALLTLAVTLFAAALTLSRHGWMLAPMAPLLAGALSWGATTAGRLAERERERRVLTDAFGAYVDPAVLQRVLDDPSRFLSLSGARKTLTVLFTDICGFTALSNRLDPTEVVAMLREYLEAMTRVITGAGGRVDKIMGDGILAVFGDPIPHEDHARRALDVALEMRVRLAALAARWRDQGRPPIAIRLGVTTGEVFVGDVGSRASKLEYTVLGSAVNLASRLEGRAPPGGVLVGQQTKEACGEEFEFEAVGTLSLKGFPERQPAWLLLGRRPEGQPGRLHARLGITCPVRLVLGERTVEGVAVNVSQGGLFVETEATADLGDAVEVEVEGRPGPRLPAKVRWVGTGPQGKTGLGLLVQRSAGDSAEASHVLAVLRFGGD